MNPLINKQCSPTSDVAGGLTLSRIEELRKHTPQWQYCATENHLVRNLRFNDFEQTMRFVNAVAEIAQQQDHHPEMLVSYSRCRVSYITHSVDAVTENDFICAALIDAKLEQLMASEA